MARAKKENVIHCIKSLVVDIPKLKEDVEPVEDEIGSVSRHSHILEESTSFTTVLLVNFWLIFTGGRRGKVGVAGGGRRRRGEDRNRCSEGSRGKHNHKL
jgi:hypothetical protein